MKRKLSYQIEDKYEGCQIERFLKALGYSRGVIIQLKKTPGGILKNNSNAHVNEKLHTGDVLHILIHEAEASPNILPNSLPLSIVYEDADILVIDKPAGMPVHPSANHYEDTLANGVAGYYKAQGVPFVFRCMNRLDRDTSGLVLLAKHALSAAVLSNASGFQRIQKEYLAIVKGSTVSFRTINLPIARTEDSIIKRTVDFTRGVPAVTHLEKLDEKNGLSLLRLWLETGRTHQIRVHLSYIGHPLIGDFLYYPENKQMERQALHSFALSFIHPVTGVKIHLKAPYPADFLPFFDAP